MNRFKEFDLPLSKEVAQQGAKAVQKEKWLKKNWRFVAICLTILLCVAMVCGTIYGVVCHFATLDALKEIVYATEIVTETTTTETATADNNGVATVGNSNTITMGGEK